MALKEDRAAVAAALKNGAKSRGLHAGLDWAGDTTDYLFYYTANRVGKAYEDDGRLRVFRYFKAKPLVVDSMQWDTLFPQDPMGTAAKRVRLRQNGAFSVPGLILTHGAVFYAPGDDPDAWAAPILDDFRGDSAEFRARFPSASAFLDAITAVTDERPDLPWRHELLRLYTLVASGDTDAAGALAHKAVAAHEGDFSVGGTTVWEMLALAYDTQTGIFEPGYLPRVP